MHSLSDYDFELPPALIAQTPLSERSASRLLQLDGATVTDRSFTDIVDLLKRGDLLVFNDTRVLKARFFVHRINVNNLGIVFVHPIEI